MKPLRKSTVGQAPVPPSSGDISGELADAMGLLDSTRDNIKASIQNEIDANTAPIADVGNTMVDYIHGALGEAASVLDRIKSLAAANLDGPLNASVDTLAQIESLVSPPQNPLPENVVNGTMSLPPVTDAATSPVPPASGGTSPFGLPERPIRKDFANTTPNSNAASCSAILTGAIDAAISQLIVPLLPDRTNLPGGVISFYTDPGLGGVATVVLEVTITPGMSERSVRLFIEYNGQQYANTDTIVNTLSCDGFYFDATLPLIKRSDPAYNQSVRLILDGRDCPEFNQIPCTPPIGPPPPPPPPPGPPPPAIGEPPPQAPPCVALITSDWDLNANGSMLPYSPEDPLTSGGKYVFRGPLRGGFLSEGVVQMAFDQVAVCPGFTVMMNDGDFTYWSNGPGEIKTLAYNPLFVQVEMLMVRTDAQEFRGNLTVTIDARNCPELAKLTCDAPPIGTPPPPPPPPPPAPPQELPPGCCPPPTINLSCPPAGAGGNGAGEDFMNHLQWIMEDTSNQDMNKFASAFQGPVREALLSNNTADLFRVLLRTIGVQSSPGSLQ